jgi:hypothetical protein
MKKDFKKPADLEQHKEGHNHRKDEACNDECYYGSKTPFKKESKKAKDSAQSIIGDKRANSSRNMNHADPVELRRPQNDKNDQKKGHAKHGQGSSSHSGYEKTDKNDKYNKSRS